MTRELEIDKDDYDAFVRYALKLSSRIPLTEFHYGLAQDKISNQEVDLENWLSNQIQSPENRPISMQKDPTPQKSPVPVASSKPAVAVSATPKANAVTAATAKPNVPVSPVMRRPTRPVKRQKSPLRLFGTAISMLFLLVMAVYVVGWYLPLEVREKIAEEEWLKSVPKDLVSLALFRGKSDDWAVTLERGKPIGVTEFEVSKPFRLHGNLVLGSPSVGTLVVKAHVSQKGTTKLTKTVQFNPGDSEAVAFNDFLEPGAYLVELEVASVMSQVKLPADIQIVVHY